VHDRETTEQQIDIAFTENDQSGSVSDSMSDRHSCEDEQSQWISRAQLKERVKERMDHRKGISGDRCCKAIPSVKTAVDLSPLLG
jgi:hypothetical protein